MSSCKRDGGEVVCPVEETAASLEKRYGGLLPKKKPLNSKNKERAFFDSADWALGKQGVGISQSPLSTAETLQPKLHRTPHRQLPPRRPSCVSADCPAGGTDVDHRG